MKKIFITSLLLACFAITSHAQDTTATKKPKATYKVGAAKVTVWENKGKDGTWKNFKVEKVYQKDGKWVATSTFNEKELLELKAALDKAIADENVKVETPEEKK